MGRANSIGLWGRERERRRDRVSESRADFIHKLRLGTQRTERTKSGLEQIVANGLFSRDKMVAIIAENQELC